MSRGPDEEVLPPREALDPEEAKERFRQTGAASSGELEDWLRQHRLGLTLGVLGTGVLLGTSPRVRRGLMTGLRLLARQLGKLAQG